MKVLKDNLLTQGMTAQELEALTAIAQEREYYKGEIIFNINDPADQLYVLAEGKVKVERLLPPPNLAIAKQVLKVKKGQVFGEMGLLENISRTATARAMSRVRLIGLEYEQLRGLFEEHNHLGYIFMNNIAMILSMRLRYIHNQLLNTSARLDFQQELEYYS